MVDVIGPAANQIATALSNTKNLDSAQLGRGKSLNASTSPDSVDEVSISNEAMEIGRVMEIVQEAKTRVESDSQVTLSNDSGRLNELV